MLQKEILEFSLYFSKSVLERRTLVEDELDTRAKNLTPQIKKCFTVQKNSDRHSIVILDNAIVKKELNERLSNELPLDSQRKTKKNDLAAYSWFDSDEFENDKREDVADSNDEIDVKYSFNETFSEVAEVDHKETITSQHGAQNRKTTSMSDLLRSVKMPSIQLERILTDKSRNSLKIVTGAVEKNIKYEKALLADSGQSMTNSKTLSKDVRFKCNEIACSESFVKKSYMAQHQKIHSGEKPYKCSVCLKSFPRAGHLKEHQRIHSGEKPYKCSFCPNSFNKSSTLKAHEITHSGNRPYKCSFCEKSFKILSTFKAHETIHSKKKPHKCSVCEKSFRLVTFLKRHERVHTGERPFNCSFCSKSFRHSGDAQRHEKIHTGERPYSCSFCSKSFRQSNDAKRHEMIHTGEKPHKCSSCESTFWKSANFKIHYKQNHKNEEENK